MNKRIKASRFLPLLVTALALLAALSVSMPVCAQKSPFPSPESAKAAGSWIATANLTTARRGHTATRLRDGRVLVAGGAGPEELASAEIFDPATERWISTGPLGHPRAFHSATLLPDGRVLVAGGHDGLSAASTWTASAEVYDPASGTWSNTASMNSSRTGHTATVLHDGTVLIAGGFGRIGNGDDTLDSAEIYDALTGSWRSAGRFAIPRYAHTATLLPDGKVLVAGGVHDDFFDYATDSAQLYDPVTGTWSAAAMLPRAMSRHAATLLPDGKVLVSGGYSKDYPGGAARVGSLDVALLFDPAAGTWNATQILSIARSQHTATSLASGEVLLAGGMTWNGTYPGITSAFVEAAELYQPESATWSSSGTLTTTRIGHTATPLLDGRVLVAGGSDFRNAPLSSVEIFIPRTTGTNGTTIAAGTWSATGNLAVARAEHTATRLADGKVLVVGGRSSFGVDGEARVELYDPATGHWHPATPLDEGITRHTATLLRDGRVLVAGGYSADINDEYFSNTCRLYDPATGTWNVTGQMRAARASHTATLLQDGTVLVAGGVGVEMGGPLGVPLRSAEIYDPNSGTWRATGDLEFVRQDHTMTPLRDGKVLVAGGTGPGSRDTDSVEVYDPVAGSWSRRANMFEALRGHTATLLHDGKVLVAGGLGASGAAQLFDPAAGTWSRTGLLDTVRYFHTATLLPSGDVLVAGGTTIGTATTNPRETDLDTVELYDADRASWSRVANLIGARSGHTATLLSDGRVLVAGGNDRLQSPNFDFNRRLDSAEIYVPAVSLDRNYTGAWYDPAQSGHGLFVEHLSDGRITASWFTFDPGGRQAWLIGVGTLAGNTVTLPMLRPEHGLFPPAFVSSGVVNGPFGEMTLRFDSCDSASLSYAFPAPFGSGAMALRRPELATRVTCANQETAGETSQDGAKTYGPPAGAAITPLPKAVGLVAAITGTWAQPDQPGHGFQMQALSNDRILLVWFVYTPQGEQMWLIGSGQATGSQGYSATFSALRPAGGRFIPDFDPDLITLPSLGSLTVTVLSCNTARIDYAFAAPFGSGSIPISRVTEVRDVGCYPWDY